MKRTFLFFIVITIQSCAVTKGWETHAVQEPNGKVYLKEMKFKESFRPEMADYIDEDAIYAWKRPETAGSPNYVVFRFFKTGQWISFSCSELEPGCINNLNQKSFVGYYNYKDGMILTEAANFNFSKAGKSEINKMIIFEDGSLYLNDLRTEMLYKKIKGEQVEKISPTW